MNDCTQTPASGESQSNKQSKAPPAAMSLSAMALLSAAPLPVPMDAQAWYIQHVALVHDLIYATVNATRVPADTGAQATLAQQALTKTCTCSPQSLTTLSSAARDQAIRYSIRLLGLAPP